MGLRYLSRLLAATPAWQSDIGGGGLELSFQPTNRDSEYLHFTASFCSFAAFHPDQRSTKGGPAWLGMLME